MLRSGAAAPRRSMSRDNSPAASGASLRNAVSRDASCEVTDISMILDSVYGPPIAIGNDGVAQRRPIRAGCPEVQSEEAASAECRCDLPKCRLGPSSELPKIQRDVTGTAGEFGERLHCRLVLLIAVLSHLDRLLDPLTDTLTPESASALLALRADADVEARIDELRRKANEGALTPAEDAEYRDFIEAVDVVSIMQAAARRLLSRQAA